MTDDARYDDRSIALHWITAGLVIALWLLGQTIDVFPRGPVRTAARSTHLLLGVVLGLVLLRRIAWRLSGATRPPPVGPAWQQKLAAATHGLLYVLLVATVAAGLTSTLIRGDNVFGLFRIPSIAPGDRALRSTFEDIHALCANTLFFVALAHAAIGLVHHLVLKDAVLRRMLRARRG